MNISDEIEKILNLKAEIKLDLINYYDTIKFDIDIKAQELLLNESVEENVRNDILKLNMDLIDRVEDIFAENLKVINKYFDQENNLKSSLDKEKIKMDALPSYCYYLNVDFLRKKINLLGILVISDWYLDKNQINYLRVKFEEEDKNLKTLKFSYDQYVLNLNMGIYLRNFVDEDDMGYIVYLKKQRIKKEMNRIDHFDLSGIKLFLDKEINFIEAIKNDTFSEATHFKVLKLHGKIVEKNTLQNMKALEHLNMSGLTEATFTNVLDDLKNVENLEKLVLQNGQIKCLQESPFSSFFKLKELDLSNNLIESLSEKVFEPLESLSRLVLKINRIREVQENVFKNCKSLKDLDLSKNMIKKVHVNGLVGLESLEKISLSFNSIKQIDKNTFKPLTNLEELEITNNEIEILDENQFNGLSKLKQLNLFQNEFLQYLDLNTFQGLSNLETLDMSFCGGIQFIQDNTFIHLTNLRELSLISCGIKRLSENTFNGLSELSRLNLSDCNIESIHRDAFRVTDKLFYKQSDEIKPHYS